MYSRYIVVYINKQESDWRVLGKCLATLYYMSQIKKTQKQSQIKT